MVALGDLVCWNNLGRNVVFADAALRPLAVFGTTLFPGEDEPSQYDLDVHAILDVPDCGLVVVLNHFGTVRAFRRADMLGSADGRLIAPIGSVVVRRRRRANGVGRRAPGRLRPAIGWRHRSRCLRSSRRPPRRGTELWGSTWTMTPSQQPRGSTWA